MRDLWTSLRLWLVTVAVCCLAFPAFLWLFAHAVAPENAGGSLIRDARGVVIGSRRIAQGFSRPEYFWPRPSATGYDAAASGGSNLSPTDPRLAGRASSILSALDVDEPVPADLVASSGSGLDPDVTERAARIQAPRVAAARGLAVTAVQARIDAIARHAGGVPAGERIVNVLELNLSLDAVAEAAR